tara:strand:+ start:123 stop:320 length:198 start_codon:yes stop_codon:yes gene_type:complete
MSDEEEDKKRGFDISSLSDEVSAEARSQLEEEARGLMDSVHGVGGIAALVSQQSEAMKAVDALRR